MTQSITLTQPQWLNDFFNAAVGKKVHDLEDQMALAIELSRRNVQHETGGPFGAAIFERDSGRLVSMGVNRVVPNNCSLAHAETMAFIMAQQSLQTYDLGSASLPTHRLVTSAQMCVMCYGALFWSGVREVYYAATAFDVETHVGFDEGPLPSQWVEEAKKRGIDIAQGPLREVAVKVLKDYQNSGQPVYNARQA
ncbi:MAG: nucleoside deaminase [Candidatus Nucleicultricaceae bacterium]